MSAQLQSVAGKNRDVGPFLLAGLFGDGFRPVTYRITRRLESERTACSVSSCTTASNWTSCWTCPTLKLLRCFVPTSAVVSVVACLGACAPSVFMHGIINANLALSLATHFSHSKHKALLKRLRKNVSEFLACCWHCNAFHP
jgi:hypothetical protein